MLEQAMNGLVDRVLIQWLNDFSGCTDTATHADDTITRYDAIRLLNIDVVLVVTPFVSDLEYVPEPVSGDRTDPGTSSLDQCIGRQCSAVYHRAKVTRLKSCVFKGLLDTPHNTGDGLVRSSQGFRRMDFTIGGNRYISEGTANINGETGLVRTIQQFYPGSEIKAAKLHC